MYNFWISLETLELLAYPFRRRRAYRQLVSDESEALIKREGDGAYYTARNVARLARDVHGDRKTYALWSKIAVEIARRTGRNTGRKYR